MLTKFKKDYIMNTIILNQQKNMAFNHDTETYIECDYIKALRLANKKCETCNEFYNKCWCHYDGEVHCQ